MSLHKDHDSGRFFPDYNNEEDIVDLDHKKQVRRMLEERLERRRLEKELEDELDGDFNWDDMEP